MDDARPTLVAAAFLVCLGSLSFTGEAAEADLPPLLAGLNSLEPPHRSIHSVMEDGDGLLWIGTFGGGLNHLDPTLRYARRICADPSTPDRCPGAVIWDLHLDDDGVLWIAGANLWSLDTRTKEARRFTLGGRLPKEGLSYIVEHSMGALWLAGFDEEWVDAGTRRTCQYTNLRPGEYVFHVRGSNNGGLWNETGAPLPAVIRPAV